MSNHEGGVPTWLDKDYIESLLQKHFSDSSLEVLNVAFEPASQVGDNYVSQLIRTFVELKDKKLNLIVKLTHETEITSNVPSATENEVIFYTELFTRLKERIDELEDAKVFSPACYGVDMERQLFVMEDLKVLNYQMHPLKEHLDMNHCILVMEALATMHGASLFALRADPGLKTRFPGGVWGSKKNPLANAFFLNGQHGLNKFKHTYGLPETCLRNLENTLKTLQDEHLKVCDLKENNLNVICHGDSWKNNMMFLYRDGSPVDVKLFDYQLLYYNCFANDLHYFLFSGTSATILVEHLYTLLEIYCKKLISVAPEDAEISFERVKAEFKERMLFGVIMSVLMRAFTISDVPPNLENVMKGEYCDLGFNKPEFSEDLKILMPFFAEQGTWK